MTAASWPLLASALSVAAPSPGGAPALAAAIRAYYDQGPEAALPLLEGAQGPDAAWWRARCRLDLDDPAGALAALDGAGTGRVEPWRRDAVRAEAALRTGDLDLAARSSGEGLATAPDGEPETRVLAWIGAGLAARAGDDARALADLARAGRDPEVLLAAATLEALPEVSSIAALPFAGGARLPEPLDLVVGGRRWRIPAAGGLARPAPEAPTRVRACPGPDLCGPDGRPLLGVAAPRWDPVVTPSGEIWYAAASEPLAEGLGGVFRLLPDGSPERATRPPEGERQSSPAPLEDGILFLIRTDGRGSRLVRRDRRGVETVLAPELDRVTRVIGCEGVVVVAAVIDGRPRVRWIPADAPEGMAARPLIEGDPDAWAPSWGSDQVGGARCTRTVESTRPGSQ